MMLNKFIGIGNLAADPESRFTPSGKQVVNFTVCCNSGWGDNKRTEFVRCVAWEKTAKVVSDYLQKGSKVSIIGEMQTRSWEDKEGVKRYTTEIIVRELVMLDSKGSKDQLSNDEKTAYGPGDPTVLQDDIPF